MYRYKRQLARSEKHFIMNCLQSESSNPQVIIKKYIMLQFETAFQSSDNEADIGRNNGRYRERVPF